jgi:hypothetical protein
LKRVLTITLGVAATGILAIVFATHFHIIKNAVVQRDSIAYWAAGKLLIKGQNPYDSATVLQLEQQHGYLEDRPLVLRTPPWSLFIVLPLGLNGPFSAWVVWMGISFWSLLVAMRLCRRLYGADGVPGDLFSVVGYTFAPIPACLVSGQMGLVLLLGIVFFIWWEQERPYLAGVALILPFAKPHLLSLFWLALLLWVVLRKRREVALGFVAAWTGAIAVALAADAHVFQHYRGMLRTASIGTEFIPALSGVIRLLFFRHFFWVQFIPVTAGLIWSAWYFLKKMSVWNWKEHGPALLTVSVLVTPYSWLADESVLLPAMLQAAAFVYHARAGLKVTTKLVLLLFALLNGLLLLILRFKIPFATGIYFWSSLVWFFWYFYARRVHRRAQNAALVGKSAIQSTS